ncbi:MAG: amidase [Lachnospiraceae bacterium]|nr:amidase [Lachnospiraceae bacterium]
MTMSNSSLVNYTRLSPNHSGQRTHSIDRISPHCVVGQCSVETLGNIFAPTSRQASCNYGIGGDGRVGMYVEEKNRSWCTSSSANDQRAVTIECASDATAPYAFRDVVYNKLVDLCVDICKRNGKKKLLWISNKNKALSYEPKSDEMLLTVHRWYANKSCPGDWLMARMDDLAAKVTARLGGSSSGSGSTTASSQLYRVRKTANDAKTQVGAYKKLSNAKKAADEHPGYAVFDESGVKVYPVSEAAVTPAKKSYTVMITASVLNVRRKPTTNSAIETQVRKGEVYTIVDESSDGKWGKLKSGAGWISLAYTRRK